MLEKPTLSDETIVACLQNEYGIHATLTFLPLGADRDTAVHRADTDEGTAYFVKLRQGVWDELAVALPKFLADQGIAQIIAPLVSKTGQLWANVDRFRLVLYPFVEGRDGYQVALTDRQWREFGAAVKRVHTVQAPAALISRIPRETYSPHWREVVKTYLARIEAEAFDHPIQARLAAFLKEKRQDILDLVGRADRLAQALQAQPREFVLCHSDLHPGNILVTADDALYIVDWDNPILAPIERDLMFPGGGQGFIGHTATEEEALFYQGYGQTQVDPVPLAYYRYQRIVEDIGVECEEIFSSTMGDRDREQEFRYLKSNWLPGNTIDAAYRSDKTL